MEKQAKPKKRRSRWRARLVAYGLAVLLAPLCAFFVILRTDWGEDRMRELVVQAMRDELHLEATLNEVHVGFLPVEVQANGILLDHPTEGRLAEAAGLTIRPSLLALVFAGKVDLVRIHIQEPHLHLLVRDGEVVNLPEIRDTGGGTDELPFRELTIDGARLSVDAEPYGRGALDGVDIAMTVSGGTDLDITVSAEHGLFAHSEGEERVQRLQAQGRFSPEDVEIGRFVLWTPHVKVSARDVEIPLPFDNTYSGHAEVRVNLAHLDDLPHGYELPPIEGTLMAEADVSSDREDGLHAEGAVHLRHARIKQFGLGDADLTVEATEQEIKIEEGTVRLIREGGTVDLAGTIGLTGTMPVDVHIGIHDLEFEKLMEQLGVSENAIVSWDMNADATLRGTLDPLDLSGPIRTQTENFLITRDPWHVTPQRRVIGVTRANLSAQVGIDPAGLRFDRIVADTPGSRLRGDVLLGFDDKLRVRASSEAINLADITPILEFEIGGTGPVNIDVTGTFDGAEVGGHLAFRNFSFNTFPFGDLESDMQLEKDGFAVRFPLVTATKNDSQFEARDLYLDFSDQRFLASAEVRAHHFTFADFYHVFHFEDDERFADYQGFATGKVDVRYTLGFPGDSHTGTMLAELDLDIPQATINGYAFHDGNMRGRWNWLHYERGYEGGELEVDDLTLRKGSGTVSVRGRMAQGGVLNFTAAADQIQIHDTEGLGDRMPDVDGIYSLLADVSGTASIPHAHMDVSVTGITYKDALLGDGRVYVRLTDRDDPWVQAAAAWDPGNLPNEPCANARSGLLRGRWAEDPPVRTVDGPRPALEKPMAFLVCGEGLDGQLAVDVAVGRTKVFPLRGLVALNGLDLAPLASQAGQGIAGTLTGRATFRGGAMLEDDSLVGRVVLDELRVGQSDVELRNQGPIDIRFERGAFRFASAELIGPSSRLTATGGGSTRGGLSTTLDGEIDLGLLSSASPQVVAASGSVALRVNISGPFQEPQIYGQALVRDGDFQLESFPEPIENLEGRVTFSARRVIFDDFRANLAGGRIGVRGDATLQGQRIAAYDLDVTARDLSLNPDDGLEVGLGGDVHVGWAQGRRLPLVTGTVRIDRAVYAKQISFDLSLGTLSRRARAEVDEYDPDRDHVELDLRVVEQTPMRVNTNVLDALVRIEDSERPFRIVGTDQRFGAIGNLALSRGIVRFRNAEFELRRGAISFDDPFRIDPHFDVQAVTELRRSSNFSGPNWRITLRATGTSEAFTLETSSEPQLSQEDIILLLTVGMTRSEAEQLQAGDLPSTAALEALAAVTGVDREVRRAVPIDDFRLTSVYSPVTGRTEPQVTIGKRIAQRVRLSASTGLGDSRQLRTTVEWRLSDQTSVQAVYDNQNSTTASQIGNVGVDLRWRLEFE